MPFIQITLWEGRSADQKAEIAKGITEVVSRVAGVAPNAVTIIFSDVKKSDWSIGGAMASTINKRSHD